MTRDLYELATAATFGFSQEIVNRSNLTVSITACAYVGCEDHIRHSAHAQNATLLDGISLVFQVVDVIRPSHSLRRLFVKVPCQ
jgi:hypothetical protein